MSPYRNYSSLLLMKKMEGRRKKRRKKGEEDGEERRRERKERKQLQATDKNSCSQTGAYLLAAEEELSNGPCALGTSF